MYSTFRDILICIGFLFFGMLLCAQNPVIEQMEHVSKLPDVEFYDVTEDPQNYIWLAADKGLYRYNGKSYKRFSHPKQKANSLFQLKLDQEGRLWCNNIYGQIFYVEKDSLKLFYDANKLVKGQLSPFVVLDNTIRLFTTSGIYDIDKTSKAVIQVFKGMCISNANDGPVNYTFIINFENEIKRHRIYKFEAGNQIKVLEINSHTRIQSPKLFVFSNTVFFTHKTAKGNIIYLINKTQNSSVKIKTPIQLQNLTIYNLLKFKDYYWFLTSSGVFVFTLKDHKLVFKEQLFKTESITDVEVDFNNNYWFTTLDNGVFVSPNLNIRYVELNTIEAKVSASCVLYDNRFVLGTTQGKLLFYDKDQLVKTIQLPGNKNIGKLYFDFDKQQLIVSINASESFVVNLNNDQVSDVSNTFSVAKTFSKINDTTLFYGNYRQAIVYTNPFKSPNKNIIRSSRVKTSIVGDNQLFVSYIDGFYKYQLDTFSSEEIKYNSNSLLVHAMTKYEHTIWLATQHNGLLKYKNNTLAKSEFQLPHQLQINNIQSDADTLWISTDKGLFQYQPKINLLRSLSTQDALNTAVDDFLILQNNIIVTLPKAFYILPKTEALFKTFKTANIKVEAVSINDSDTIIKPKYKLPYNLNKIGIAFNSNGFLTNQHVNYQYRVKQLDTSWQHIPPYTHSVHFNSLSHGTYTVELKAQNESAKSPVYSSPISFVIAKPFWETYWFYGLVLVSIFGLVWLYFRWRLRQKETQRIAEIDKILTDKKITNLRLENLRSQMNPHFIFNALNSIQDYIISNEKALASSYLVKFSRLIRMYLEYSQQNEITLEEEIKALQLYLELEKVRFEDELDYQVHIEEQLHTKQIKVPSLFIQPYVENALKHGLLHKPKNRKLLVEAKMIQQDKLQITVVDNGIGRKQSEKIKRSNQQHKPFATKANEERVHLYKNKLKRDITIVIEDLHDENQHPLGTKVVITMSIH